MAGVLQCILFYGATADAVCSASRTFATGKKGRLVTAGESDATFISVHMAESDWVVIELAGSQAVNLDNEWELNSLREYYLFVSRVLWCPGFFVFIADLDYWGYEFFAQGQVFDCFLQEDNEEWAPAGFEGADCSGKVEVLVEQVPSLEPSVVAPYLVRRAAWEVSERLGSELQPAREGDEFDLFDQHAAVDFLRALGISARFGGGYFSVDSPVHCTFGRSQQRI
jgi:hypothetical protein